MPTDDRPWQAALLIVMFDDPLSWPRTPGSRQKLGGGRSAARMHRAGLGPVDKLYQHGTLCLQCTCGCVPSHSCFIDTPAGPIAAGRSHLLSTRRLHITLWTGSVSSRLGEIDCLLPIAGGPQIKQRQTSPPSLVPGYCQSEVQGRRCRSRSFEMARRTAWSGRLQGPAMENVIDVVCIWLCSTAIEQPD